jgi:hypothetical protein
VIGWVYLHGCNIWLFGSFVSPLEPGWAGANVVSWPVSAETRMTSVSHEPGLRGARLPKRRGIRRMEKQATKQFLAAARPEKEHGPNTSMFVWDYQPVSRWYFSLKKNQPAVLPVRSSCMRVAWPTSAWLPAASQAEHVPEPITPLVTDKWCFSVGC